MQNKQECLTFLSWQSDRKDCRSFVNKVIDNITKSNETLAKVVFDRDTLNVPGSPDIGDTIFEKIDKCDLFIADITLINDEDSSFRRTPNPNVMIELGYAIRTLGWERILLLQCKDYGDIEELPFDINHRRIINFSIENKTESLNSVIGKISKTIDLLLEKGLLFGGKRGKTPKFDVSLKQTDEIMRNLVFSIRNVSNIFVSNLQAHDLYVVFSDQNKNTIEYNPSFVQSSLSEGEQTVVRFENEILGAGKGYNNAVWNNIDIIWQFSCEDQDGTQFWYEMKKHVNRADEYEENYGSWPVRSIS